MFNVFLYNQPLYNQGGLGTDQTANDNFFFEMKKTVGGLLGMSQKEHTLRMNKSTGGMLGFLARKSRM